MENEDVNIGGQDGAEFDESTIPDDVRKKIVKEAQAGRIPKERYDTSIKNLTDQIQNLENKVEKNAAPAKQPAKYTRSQLRAGVDNGTITEAQMEDVWANQCHRESMDEARRVAESSTTAASAKDKIAGTLSSYNELVDGLAEPGSDNRVLVEEAYSELVSLQGKPSTTEEQQRLEAAACLTAFGPLSKLKGRVDSLKKHGGAQEVGGGGSDDTAASASKGVPAQHKAYYQKMIDNGQYSGWPEVEKLLKTASPAVKDRMS